MIDSATTATAKASYDRCCKSPDFLHTFYRTFIAGCPAAGPLFAHTNFDQQTRLLRHAISLLLVFPTQPSNEPVLLARVAERHSRRGLNIDPSLYRPFIDALIETVNAALDRLIQNGTVGAIYARYGVEHRLPPNPD